MDLLGALPERAWFDIWDEKGNLIVTIEASCDAGQISAELPAFPPGTLGRITDRYDNDPAGPGDGPLEELPTLPSVRVILL